MARIKFSSPVLAAGAPMRYQRRPLLSHAAGRPRASAPLYSPGILDLARLPEAFVGPKTRAFASNAAGPSVDGGFPLARTLLIHAVHASRPWRLVCACALAAGWHSLLLIEQNIMKKRSRDRKREDLAQGAEGQPTSLPTRARILVCENTLRSYTWAHGRIPMATSFIRLRFGIVAVGQRSHCFEGETCLRVLSVVVPYVTLDKGAMSQV
ncbi:hypothetical protein HPB51_004658 [Rhipicephalus microplus]|uniref:Uncharacterized protein n=1 Tax=Rhipicephalus microplus TaxID=6941 RepID=A0A9J6EF14_RHIMP|nr:hypothetical protein HPB51_004658 [Rhipicephalus microplus]